ncbi:MAG: hypothetical protein ACLFR1_13590 [Spirochaetia bacterium]
MKKLFLLLFIISVSLFGCEYFFPEEAELVEWQQDADGYSQFRTNVDAVVGSLVLASLDGSLTQSSDFDYVAANIIKNSGNTLAPYGIVFGLDANNMSFYSLLINLEGDFIFVKYVNNTPSVLIPWTNVGDIISAETGAINTLRVDYLGNNEFAITINDTEVTRVTEEEAPTLSGATGYAVAVAENEDFPDTPVDARFMQTYPEVSGTVTLRSLESSRILYNE